MDLDQITLSLRSDDVQDRLQAVAALRAYDPAIAVPLLCSRLNDTEFLVRSMVATNLGRKRNAEAFQALLRLVEEDPDPSVRAEAAGSLGQYQQQGLIPLREMFERDSHWLVRQSILTAIADMNAPLDLFKLSSQALHDPDLTVREAGITALADFAETDLQTAALDQLLPQVQAEHWQTRAAIARALRRFDNYEAREALVQMQRDEDHRVIAAILDGLV